MMLPNDYSRCTGDIVGDETPCEKRERCLRYKDRGIGLVSIVMGESDCGMFIGVSNERLLHTRAN